ncbi:MAG: DUF456 domain-containing protein [bacterium]|nr:DUF456 domain-containing protein [bacterium]
MTILLWIAAVILIIAGLVGIIIPMIPGIPLMFAGFLIAAWIGKFQTVGLFTIFVLGFLTVISIIIDFLSAGFGAKRVGASREAVIGAVLGTIFGLSAGFLGVIVGPFIGAALGEYIARRDLSEAGNVGVGTWLGIMLGTVAKIGLAFMMLGIFITSFLL